MFNNDSIFNDIDLFSNPNRFISLNNDPNNIWSAETYNNNNNIDFNNKQKLILNSPPFLMQDRFSRSRKPPGDRRDTNLIVNYLPDGFYEKELFDLFSQAGPILHHHVVRNKDNRSECYGFVDFEKALDAEKAIEMFHQYPIQNKKLKVQNAAEGLMIKEEERHRALKCISNIGYNVEIRNAPIRWTINDVKNIFGKFGELLKVYENGIEDIEAVTDIKTKTFNIIYRYYTIAMKAVKKKNKSAAEPLWPLELELSILGQEIVDISSENCRPRQRLYKQKFDQMSDSSWDNKNEVLYQNNFEPSANYWTENSVNNQICLPFSSNGRPILKHKDNLINLSNSIFESSEVYNEKWCNTISNDSTNLFFDNIRVNDIKAIWAPKDAINNDLIPLDIYIKTPLLPSRFQSNDIHQYKANIWYKMENLQPTGSFKLRGVSIWCYNAKIDGIQTVICSSEANAGLATAYVCRLLMMKCVVVVPLMTPEGIISELLKEGAEVIQEGSNWKAAYNKADQLCLNIPRSRLMQPQDDPLLWSGYETIIDEIITDMKGARIDMIVLAVGEGDLLNGITQGISRNKLSTTTAILAMETEGNACFNRSIASKDRVTITPNGMVSSLGMSSISQRTWELYCSNEYHIFSKTCSSFEAVESSYQFLNEQNCLVEPAFGAALAAVYNGTLDKMAECRSSDLNVVVIVCGGRCIDIKTLLESRHNLSSLVNNNYDFPSPPSNNNIVSSDMFTDLNKTSLHYSPSVTPPLSNYSNLYTSATAQRNYATVVTDGKFPFSLRNNNVNSNNYGEVLSPVGSQHSDKENQMLHLH